MLLKRLHRTCNRDEFKPSLFVIIQNILENKGNALETQSGSDFNDDIFLIVDMHKCDLITAGYWEMSCTQI